MKLSVVIPARNEEGSIAETVRLIADVLRREAIPYEIVVVDDGSTDSTVPIARSRQQQMPLVILDCPINKGLGAGLRALVEYTVANADEDGVLVAMDCDDTHDPAQIVDMLRGLDTGADVVIGSRYVRGALVRGVPPLRRLTALGAAALFKLVHPVRGVWDYTCGYRAYRASVLKKAASRYGDQLIAESGFACMVELLLKLNGLGARFAEIPLQLRYDQKPTETKMGVGRHTRRLLLLLVRWRLRGFHEA